MYLYTYISFSSHKDLLTHRSHYVPHSSVHNRLWLYTRLALLDRLWNVAGSIAERLRHGYVPKVAEQDLSDAMERYTSEYMP